MKTREGRSRDARLLVLALLVGCSRTELDGDSPFDVDGAVGDRPVLDEATTDRPDGGREDVPIDRPDLRDVTDVPDTRDVADVPDREDVLDVPDVIDGGCFDCGVGAVCCGEVCRDVGNDSANCGGCGIACGFGARCVAGSCVGTMACNGGPVCDAGQVCCLDGCQDLRSDFRNCGGCGRTCAAGNVCVDGACRPTNACGPGGLCARGQLCCDSRCIDVLSDRVNCGACGLRCGDTQRCTAGRCESPGCGDGGACAAGSVCCVDRCADLQTDPTNCGACGLTCRAGQECAAGLCTTPPMGCGGGPACDPGRQCCGVFCVDVSGDAANCGACGRACVAPPGTSVTCRASTCVVGSCLPGFADCNGQSADGCEVNTGSDALNCGRCGAVCMAGATCSDGVCGRPSSGAEGAFNPTVNPTYLRPGVHNFTTINVPAGVVVFVAGGGADNGTLDLRATSDVVVDGTIDVSGGPGSQSTITSRSTRQGRAGAGGFTGDPRTATPGPACEWVAGVSGGNGRGAAGTTGTCTVGSNTACITDNRTQLIFASPTAQFGGGGGVFTGYRAYGAGGGGYAGGGAGALGAAYPGQGDCRGVTGGGGTATGRGASSGASPVYNGRDGVLGQTQCPGTRPDIPAAWVGGGGGGSIGTDAASDLAIDRTFYPGSGGGGGSGDYLNRPAFGGTSGGGGGGGALRIWSDTRITINGQLLANGGEGGDAYIGTNRAAGCDPQPGAAGGGGSGGVVFLRAPTLTVTSSAQVSAVGGLGGASSLYATGGAGGAGGPGRIRLSVDPARCRLDGRFTPSLTGGCSPSVGTGVAGQAFVAAYPR
jgi:hypothetical protein